MCRSSTTAAPHRERRHVVHVATIACGARKAFVNSIGCAVRASVSIHGLTRSANPSTLSRWLSRGAFEKLLRRCCTGSRCQHANAEAR